MIAISNTDYTNLGCPSCGCTYAYSQGVSGGGTNPVVCGECNKKYVVLADGLPVSGMNINGETPLLIEHPRIGLWPHEYVKPDIKPLGIDGEFWAPRGLGYDLSGFVKTKEAGERIINMIVELLPYRISPKSWLDYRKNEPNWIQVKIQKGDGFDLEILRRLCQDGVINKKRLANALVLETKIEDQLK